MVQARTTATMTARILAPVREVRVAPGDRVREGQTLIVLDGDDLAAGARGARSAALAAGQGATAAAAEQQAAEAGLALARASHDRIAGLAGQALRHGAGTRRRHWRPARGEAARARRGGRPGALQAVSGVDSARAASEAAATTESFALITAPFDGVVTEKMVEPGNMAAPGTPLMRVEDTRGFRLDVRVDESRIGQIAPGAIVPVSLDAGTGGATTTVSGTVAEIEPRGGCRRARVSRQDRSAGDGGSSIRDVRASPLCGPDAARAHGAGRCDRAPRTGDVGLRRREGRRTRQARECERDRDSGRPVRG